MSITELPFLFHTCGNLYPPCVYTSTEMPLLAYNDVLFSAFTFIDADAYICLSLVFLCQHQWKTQEQLKFQKNKCKLNHSYEVIIFIEIDHDKSNPLVIISTKLLM